MHVFKLHTLCQYYDLGTPRSALIDISGGFLHEITKLETNQGSFAIKCLNPSIVKQFGLAHFSQNEAHAKMLAAYGIPACVSLKADAPILTISKQHYLVYPWIEGQTLERDDITLDHAASMGSILAAIHQQAIQPEVVNWPKTISLPNAQTFKQYSEWLKESPLQAALKDALSIIQDVLAAYKMMQPMLMKEAWIWSHTDLTHNNVIWQNNHPTIIDWELAGPIMPGQDILATALNWSLDSHGYIRWPLFEAFIKAYKNTHPLPAFTHLSIIAVFVDWLNWIAWNLERVFDINLPDSKRQLSAQLANYSLTALINTYQVKNSFNSHILS